MTRSSSIFVVRNTFTFPIGILKWPWMYWGMIESLTKRICIADGRTDGQLVTAIINATQEKLYIRRSHHRSVNRITMLFLPVPQIVMTRLGFLYWNIYLIVLRCDFHYFWVTAWQVFFFSLSSLFLRNICIFVFHRLGSRFVTNALNWYVQWRNGKNWLMINALFTVCDLWGMCVKLAT